MPEALKTILTTRGTQLLSRWIAGLLLAYAGYSAGQADSSAATVASVLIALALYVADLAIHNTRIGRIVAQQLALAMQTADRVRNLFGNKPPLSLVLLGLCLTGLVATTTLTGCATSKAFAEGVVRVDPLLDPDLRHYAGSDLVRLSQVNALKSATANRDTVSADAVANAWLQIRDWYLAGVDADPLLDPMARKLRHDNAARFDKLIADERGRPLRPAN